MVDGRFGASGVYWELVIGLGRNGCCEDVIVPAQCSKGTGTVWLLQGREIRC